MIRILCHFHCCCCCKNCENIFCFISHLHKFIFTTEIFIWCTGRVSVEKKLIQFFLCRARVMKNSIFFPHDDKNHHHHSLFFFFLHTHPIGFIFVMSITMKMEILHHTLSADVVDAINVKWEPLNLIHLLCVLRRFPSASVHNFTVSLSAEFDTFPLVTMKCELKKGDGGECIYDDDNNVDNDAERLKRMLMKVYNIAIF